MKNQTKETKKQFEMEQAFAMWKKKSESGSTYFTGSSATGERLIGFYNGKKKNPKEPDVRIYYYVKGGKLEQEFCSMWVNLSKNEKKYLSGKMSNNKKVVGFINEKATEKQPYFSVYFSEGEPKAKEVVEQQEFNEEAVKIEDLPF